MTAETVTPRRRRPQPHAGEDRKRQQQDRPDVRAHQRALTRREQQPDDAGGAEGDQRVALRTPASRRGRFRVCVHALRNSGVTIIMPSASPNHQIRRNWKYTVPVPGIRS